VPVPPAAIFATANFVTFTWNGRTYETWHIEGVDSSNGIKAIDKYRKLCDTPDCSTEIGNALKQIDTESSNRITRDFVRAGYDLLEQLSALIVLNAMRNWRATDQIDSIGSSPPCRILPQSFDELTRRVRDLASAVRPR